MLLECFRDHCLHGIIKPLVVNKLQIKPLAFPDSIGKFFYRPGWAIDKSPLQRQWQAEAKPDAQARQKPLYFTFG